MGDRHGGRFARRGRALTPPRPHVDAPLGESLPTRRTSEKICPAQKHAPRRRPPDTAHERKDLPHARRLSSAKASRHGARAKGFVPRRNTPLGEGLPTRRTSERICRARTLPTAKVSRHGARAKGFAPRRNTPHGEGLPTRRTSERICPAGFVFAPRADERRAAPDRRTAGKTPLRRGRTRHGARAKGFAPRRNALLGKGLPTRRTSEKIYPRRVAPHDEGLPTRRTSERICPARERSPRRKPPDTAHEQKDLPRGVRVRPTCRRTAGRPRPTDSRKNTPSAGSHPQRAAAAEFIHLKK